MTGNLADFRLYAAARKDHREMSCVTPGAVPETPDYGGWLRPRRL